MNPGHDVRTATLARLAVLEERVARAVTNSRIDQREPVDGLHGLLLTDQHVARIVGEGRTGPLASGSLGPLIGTPHDGLARRLGLDEIGVDLLVIAAAPELDPRFEQLFGYLHDDVTQRRASIGLSLRLTGHDLTDVAARHRFAPSSPLRRSDLVEIVDDSRPFVTRPLRVPDRVVNALLGDDRLLSEAIQIVTEPLVGPVPWVTTLALSIASGIDFVHVEDRPEMTALALATSAAVLASGTVVVVEIAPGVEPDRLIVEAMRESLLRHAALLVCPIEEIVNGSPRLFDHLAAHTRPVVVVGRGRWRPEWTRRVPLALVAPPLDEHERVACWDRALDGELDDPGPVTAAFRLGPQRIERAATAALLAARHRGSRLDVADVHAGARQQNASGLQRLARRIEPVARWADLVVSPAVSAALHELTARVRHRAVVLDEWRLRRGGGRGDGLTAMFAGPSGTGKTLAAEVIAGELGLDLHTVDLATVVDKYIGETEKNLDRIFDEAEQVNTVLFFDEADALFGKRSEVRDARDRYANVEVAYLLQRMEQFDGLAILATNLRLNIDEAFARRLDMVVDFPRPDENERTRLWHHLLGTSVPTADDVDLELLAASFELSGGDIRNAVVSAAFLAADAGRDVAMVDLVRGVAREYRKLGRLCLRHEFGEWFDALDETAVLQPSS